RARIEDWERAAARRRWDLPQDAHVIGYIGRAAAVKNRPFLVDVHRAVRDVLPATRLLIVGPCGTDDLVSAHPDVPRDPSVILGGETRRSPRCSPPPTCSCCRPGGKGCPGWCW